MEAVHGIRLSPYAFVGLDYLCDKAGDDTEAGLLAAFADARGHYPGSPGTSIYTAPDLGAAIGMRNCMKDWRDRYVAAGSGITIGSPQNRMRLDPGIRHQHLGEKTEALLSRIGFNFRPARRTDTESLALFAREGLSVLWYAICRMRIATKFTIMKTENTNTKTGNTAMNTDCTTGKTENRSSKGTGEDRTKTGNAASRAANDADSKRRGNSHAAEVGTGDTQSEFHHFFVEQLKDIYWAEKHLKKGLQKMRRAATSPRLTAAFEKHYGEGDKQIADLETIFALLGEKPEAKRCEAMAGLLQEAEEMITDTRRNSFVRDAGLILAAQKVEHYEIATYGTLRTLAAYLPEKRVQKMLEKTLAGEKKTDELLTRLAEEFINECAAVE